MRRVVLAAALVLLVAVPSALAASPTAPRYDQQGRLVKTPFAPAPPKSVLTEQQAIASLLGVPKVEHWLKRYPRESLVKQATFNSTYRDWDVKVWSGKAGEIASGRVDDASGITTEA